MQGLSAEEINGLQNFVSSVGNITGEAGSVVSYEGLTLTPASGSAVSVTAGKDGSFKAALDADAGSSVQITGDLRTNTAVTMP